MWKSAVFKQVSKCRGLINYKELKCILGKISKKEVRRDTNAICILKCYPALMYFLILEKRPVTETTVRAVR